MQTTDYVSIADELAKRIAALIPAHPEILYMDDPLDLFKIEGFDCSDLEPSIPQAQWALSKAKTGE